MYRDKSRWRWTYKKEKYSDDNALFLLKSALFFIASFASATIYLKAIAFLVVESSWPRTMMVLGVFLTIVLAVWLLIVSNRNRLKANWGPVINDDLVMLVAVCIWTAALPAYLVVPALANLHRGLGLR